MGAATPIRDAAARPRPCWAGAAAPGRRVRRGRGGLGRLDVRLRRRSAGGVAVEAAGTLAAPVWPRVFFQIGIGGGRLSSWQIGRAHV